MIEVKKEGYLITKTDFEFENEGVLNPAIIREGDSVHMFYRACIKTEIIRVLVIAGWMAH